MASLSLFDRLEARIPLAGKPIGAQRIADIRHAAFEGA